MFSSYKYSDLTGKIIGCAMQVHRILGNSFQEVIYQRALAIELAEKGILFEREKEIPVYYKGHVVGSRRPDFIVETKICIELKALTFLENSHSYQAKGYLEAYKLELGLLINFGAESLEFKRIYNNKFNVDQKI
ncbi:GxxExxY protein [Chitinophaga vietnamensis]|uniref:GxxExxY protein n=1 Tax=Chitinophaga vietnamensis TaxID=2593957 RepID=UPI0011781867|nr:GxxExxY protein [Chitinophaga vietnamensis]